MNIRPTDVQTFRIIDAERLDPITVFLDDHEPGRGTLTVRCFDRAWTCYWGGMGDGKSLAQFMTRSVSAEYIANCLVRGNRGVITSRTTEEREEAYVLRIAHAMQIALKQVTP